MIVFRMRYPRWWFDFLLETVRFGTRVGAYALLWRDEYPSTDEAQAVHLHLDYPDATRLNRWLPLVKWLLAIPHYIVLVFLGIAALVVTVIAWLLILITGEYPRSLFDFTVSVQSYGLRVSAYALYLVTDTYPPFSLS
jgi:asparagine N-glycosylation enzyme membrane subunit Stt3